MRVPGIFKEERGVFSSNIAGTSRHPHAKRVDWDPHLTKYAKINLKCIKSKYRTKKL
jgi:hypothetical protein